VLTGGAGSDTLIGGAGDDTFVFGSVSGNDVILDFEEGSDLIRISKGINGLQLGLADDLAAHVYANHDGNAVIELSHGGLLTIVGVAAEDFQADPSRFAMIA
jgi:Ca2+-binding RTX toxin-like protein